MGRGVGRSPFVEDWKIYKGTMYVTLTFIKRISCSIFELKSEIKFKKQDTHKIKYGREGDW